MDQIVFYDTLQPFIIYQFKFTLKASVSISNDKVRNIEQNVRNVYVVSGVL